MSEIPEELRYTQSHEWVRQDEEGVLVVGITDYAQDALGDLVFVELPETDKTYGAGDACAVLESVKAASDVYSPVDGEVIEVNENLSDSPELINEDCYGDGWMFKLQPQDDAAFDGLLNADGYQEVLEED